jgi:hypothetical protein
MNILRNIDALMWRREKREERYIKMKTSKFFSILIAVAVLFIAFAVPVVSSADEQITPTFKDLEGKWSGKYQTNGFGRTSSGSIDVTFTRSQNGSIILTTLSDAGGHYTYDKVTLGKSIEASCDARDTSLRLYKRTNGSLVLKGDYTMKSATSKLNRSSTGGTYTFEKVK